MKDTGARKKKKRPGFVWLLAFLFLTVCLGLYLMPHVTVEERIPVTGEQNELPDPGETAANIIPREDLPAEAAGTTENSIGRTEEGDLPDEPKSTAALPSAPAGSAAETEVPPASAVSTNPPMPGSQETAQTGHVHEWVEEVVEVHPAVTETVHHDAVTEERWVSVPVRVMRAHCTTCGAVFDDQADADAHLWYWMQRAADEGDHSLQHISYQIWADTVDQGYYETVTVQDAYDEVVEITPAWTEYIFRCRTCGATA